MRSTLNFLFINIFMVFTVFLLLTSCEDELEKDCAGVAGGSAVVDSCNVCDDDPTNDCVVDCAGEWGGSNICGCIDSTAINYNINATFDDGGCLYDTESPTIQMTSYFGDPVADTISITMMATDNIGIEKVELWVDGSSTGLSDTTEPYEIHFGTRTIENGAHTIIGRAFDLSGNYADSQPQILTVYNDYDPPVVAFEVEFSGVWSDTVDINVYAYDEFGIDSVELFINGLSTGLSYSVDTQYSTTYVFNLPTEDYANGIHYLMALAYDVNGYMSSSDSIALETYNAPALLLESNITDLSVGDSPIVSILAERFPAIFAISLQISYDDSLLFINDSTGFNSGTFFGDNNITFATVESSTIYLTNSLTQGQEEVSGFGDIGSLVFNAQAVGQDTLEIIDYHFYDSEGNEVYINDLNIGSLDIIIQ